ncbi:hypothetical protein HK405_005225, partial [Cladochytrium tenue]
MPVDVLRESTTVNQDVGAHPSRERNKTNPTIPIDPDYPRYKRSAGKAIRDERRSRLRSNENARVANEAKIVNSVPLSERRAPRRSVQRGEKKQKDVKIPRYLRDGSSAAPAETTMDGAQANAKSDHVAVSPQNQKLDPQVKRPTVRPAATRPAVARPSRPTPTNEPPSTPLADELAVLERRFRHSGYTVEADRPHPTSTEPTIVELGLAPSDPDFPFDLPVLRLRLLLRTDGESSGGRSGVAGHSRIKVLNSEIPGELARRIERGWERRAEALISAYVASSAASQTQAAANSGPSVLVGMFNWLDRELEALLSGSRESAGAITLVRNDQVSADPATSRYPVSALTDLDALVPREQLPGAPRGFKDRVFYYGVPNDSLNDGAESDDTASDFDDGDDGSISDITS